MKILAISDCESRALWDFYTPGKLEGLDLILSCGDLDPRYLSFLATFASCPILYVHGNHDGKNLHPPAACVWRTACTSIRGYASWGWAAPCGTAGGPTNILSVRCVCGL